MPQDVQPSTRSIAQRDALHGALLFVAYFATARIGLLIDPVAGVATTVWPPTGIALAALLLWGTRMWPAVALGALLVNVSVGVPVVGALGMAAGNTLEAVVGAGLLSRVPGFDRSLERVPDVLALVVLAALGSTLVSASCGMASLWLIGVMPREGYGYAWRVWWMGDLMGDLIVAPLLLAWGSRPAVSRVYTHIIEALVLGGGLMAMSLLTFGVLPAGDPGAYVLREMYVLFPFLIWAALRFGQRGAVTAIFLVSAVATIATARGLGPFVRETRNEGLLLLHSFLGIYALTALILGAALSERNRAVRVREEFLSIAAHELRSPLSALTLQLQRLARLLRGGAGPDGLQEGLAASVRQVGRLNQLVENLLDVSRIAAARLTLSREEVELGALAREVVARLGDELAQRGCEVTVDAEGPATGRWDRLRIEQVLTNFLTNAMRYGPGRPISIGVRADEQKATLVVRDQGPGIAAADQARIFGLFERAASGPQAGGLGLGLYIVRQIVEAHGGTVQVHSAPGPGAAFTVELPRDVPDAAGTNREA